MNYQVIINENIVVNFEFLAGAKRFSKDLYQNRGDSKIQIVNMYTCSIINYKSREDFNKQMKDEDRELNSSDYI